MTKRNGYNVRILTYIFEERGSFQKPSRTPDPGIQPPKGTLREFEKMYIIIEPTFDILKNSSAIRWSTVSRDQAAEKHGFKPPINREFNIPWQVQYHHLRSRIQTSNVCQFHLKDTKAVKISSGQSPHAYSTMGITIFHYNHNIR